MTCNFDGSWSTTDCKKGKIFNEHLSNFLYSIFSLYPYQDKIYNNLKKCVVVVCEALNLPNGFITYSKSSVEGGYPIDAEVSFSCHNGYHCSGTTSSICKPSGSWSLQTPTCQKGSLNKVLSLHFTFS